MKTSQFLNVISKSTVLAFFGLLFVACTNHDIATQYHGDAGLAVDPSSMAGNTTAKAGPIVAISGGPNQTGVLVATTAGAVARIENGLERKVDSTKGNFRKSLNQVSTNLPKTANVMSVSGYDQVELLAYSACSDLTTGGTPLMQSVYNVNPSATVAANQAALIAAGIRMLDQHTAGIASQGPASAQVTTIFTDLVTTEGAVGTNTSKIVFMTVCIAANTAGTTMLGL